MRRVLVLLVLLSVACALPGLVETPETAPPSLDAVSATSTAAPPSTVVRPQPTFTPTSEPLPSPTPESDPRLDADDVLVVPQPLAEGDHVSIDVDPWLPADFEWEEGAAPKVILTTQAGVTITESAIPTGLDDSPQARFYWVAEVPEYPSVFSGQAEAVSSNYVLTLTLELPKAVRDTNLENNTVVLAVPVRPRDTLAPPEPGTQWAITETAGFALHYLTGSTAERDLPQILSEADSALADVTEKLSRAGKPVNTDRPVDIYLLDRVVGQGGYASSDWVAISYTERDYPPVSLDLVFRHELTHRLDGAIECDGAPAMFREGLAVLLAGGHYRSEPLREKAAALLATTHYVPISDLVEDFYTHQHEVAYLEVGSIAKYLVEQFGWEILPRFCRAASEADGSDLERWEMALQEIGILDTGALEREWRMWLRASDAPPYDPRFLDLELQLMQAMRDYQLRYDPAAHFLEGILFSPAEAERMGIVADFTRRPRDAEAVALELLLSAGQDALVRQDAVLLEMVLAELDLALDDGIELSAFAAGVEALSRTVLAQGWEPYRFVLEADDCVRIYVADQSAWPQQSVLVARRVENAWEFSGTIGSD